MAHLLYKITVLNSAMKPAVPPVLRATRLLDQVRERIRYKHYNLHNEPAYVQWVRMFEKWHRLRHPRDKGQLKIGGFLAMMANERRVRLLLIDAVYAYSNQGEKKPSQRWQIYKSGTSR